MAQAEKTTVTREVTTTVEEDAVVLTLTVDEARVLRALTGNVDSISGNKELRDLAEGVWKVLVDGGIDYGDRHISAHVTGLWRY